MSEYKCVMHPERANCGHVICLGAHVDGLDAQIVQLDTFRKAEQSMKITNFKKAQELDLALKKVEKELEQARVEDYHAVEEAKDLKVEVATLQRHLEHSEARRREDRFGYGNSRPDGYGSHNLNSPSSLKAQISGLLWQVTDLGRERGRLKDQITLLMADREKQVNQTEAEIAELKRVAEYKLKQEKDRNQHLINKVEALLGVVAIFPNGKMVLESVERLAKQLGELSGAIGAFPPKETIVETPKACRGVGLQANQGRCQYCDFKPYGGVLSKATHHAPFFIPEQ